MEDGVIALVLFLLIYLIGQFLNTTWFYVGCEVFIIIGIMWIGDGYRRRDG